MSPRSSTATPTSSTPGTPVRSPGVEGKTRPIVQTGNYGEFIGQIQLTIDTEDHVGHRLQGRQRQADHLR